MLAQIVSPVGTVRSCEEDFSNMDPERDFDELSYSEQAREPFSVSDAKASLSSIAPDVSSSEVLSCALNSISLVEISEQRDDEGNDKVRLDDTVGMKSRDNVCSSPPRKSARATKFSQKNTSKKAGKGCGKQENRNKMLDSILLSVERKTRSYDCRHARSSVWGSNSISKYFEKSACEVIKNGSKKSTRGRGARGSRKGKSAQVVTGLQVSNANTGASSGRIRIKVKLCKEMGRKYLTDMVPGAETDIVPGAENVPQNVESIGIGTNKINNFSGNNPNEELLGVQGGQCCFGETEKVVISSKSFDICPSKDLERSVTGEKSDGFVADNNQGIPSPVDAEGSGVAVDNKYLDSGTSPDSEVINLIPEAQVNGKEREDFHDVQISSQACVAPADILSLNLPVRSRKKGKKSNNTSSACKSSVQDKLERLGTLDKFNVFEKSGQGEKLGDGLDFSEAAILTTTVNLSSNKSSSEGSRGELLPSSMAGEMENALPSTKNKGQKQLKSFKSKQGSKNGSEVESPRSRKGNACRLKGNAVKSIGKKKVKDKAACGEFARTAQDYHETGFNFLDVLEKAKIGDGNTAQEKLDVDVARGGAPSQCIFPRNAWVRCDECFKWRRIPAILADSIDEENSRWTCKENVDKDFADCSIPQEKSNSEINAELEISDASCEEDSCHGGFSPKQLQPNNPFGDQEQSSWRLIRSNMFMQRNRKSQTIDEIMVCHCKPPTNGKLGCGDGCLNRLLNIECVQGTCPCGEHCSNQQFQKRNYAKLRWFRCGKKGYGLQLLEDICEGQFLIEYVGEVLDMQAYEARQRDYALKGHKHFYFMTLNGGEVIDACAKGNLGRFINHSCDPNCRTEKWMVNGEVCVGLFALKDLKKGEEVTFDYNYVRVFGAAAKKCVCGSSNCRGYIGGDPQNSDVIVQGDSDDEFPEPVMFCDDGEVDDSLRKLISTSSSLDDAKASIASEDQALTLEDKLERAETVVEHFEGPKELQLGDLVGNDNDKIDESENNLEAISRKSGSEKLEVSFEPSKKSVEALQPSIEEVKSPSQKLAELLQPSIEEAKSPSQLDIDSVDTISDPRQAILLSLEASAMSEMKKKSVSDSSNIKKKHKTNRTGDRCAPESRTLMKTFRSSSSVRKSKPERMVNKSHGLLYKPEKITEGSTTVEGKLNELLDDEGGISKRQDATKGYLKLLLLTAASGDSGSGEAIQSNRELSMILGAILKTQSRSVLVDVINKNGLQMLHNILKRCRRDFSRIPILRKLLKVLEFLASKNILSKELINKDPSCAGVESFRESILSLAEHDDKQVHQIARNFRDKWIPWSLRRNIDFHRGFNGSRHSPHDHWRERSSQCSDEVNSNKQSIPASGPVSVDVMNGGCPSLGRSDYPTSGTPSRKRKSRWDEPADSNKEPNLQPGVNHMKVTGKEELLETRVDDEKANMDGDVPPGFAPACTASSIKGNGVPCKVELGLPQGKFRNRLAVSYGIPMPIVQQLGYPKTDGLEDWFIAPGVPFQPYPPLPPYSRNGSDDTRDGRGNYQPPMSQSDHNPPSTSGSVPFDFEIQGTNNRHGFQEARSSHGMGRYLRQQKCNSSRLPPPWKRKRNGWGFTGNDTRNRMCSGRMGSSGNNMEINPSSFTHNPQQETYY